MECLFKKQVRWLPNGGIELSSEVGCEDYTCWKCEKKCQNSNKHFKFFFFGHMLARGTFFDDDVASFILEKVPTEILRQNKIGPVKKRFNNTLQGSHISSGCFYCVHFLGRIFYLAILRILLDNIV